MSQSCQIQMDSSNKNGNFTSRPGLTAREVETHLSKSSSTVNGHLNQQRMNARSTKIKEERNTVTTEGDFDYGIKTNCIYAATIDAGQINTDQTGRFPVISSKGNKYIMLLNDYDGNAILAEPIKNRTAPELLRAFQVMEKKLTARGFQPKLMRLDNEALQLIKSYLHDKNIAFKLVPPYTHRRNAAEREIRSFKDHLFAGICSTDKAFPMHLWDRLLSQSSNNIKYATHLPNISQVVSLNTH
jgi:hypothetical protein